MKNLTLINPEDVSEDEANSYQLREAARAIVIDDEKNIALLHVSKENYYTLPGGGIEQSESKESALLRECLEEIGSNVEIIREIGSIVEYRKIFKLKQVSYCYLAKVIGEKGTPSLTAEELGNGFQHIWVSYHEAATLLSNNTATNLEGKSYILPRDITFLKATEEYFSEVIPIDKFIHDSVK